MAEYTKMKNADLEALLKERNLPHTGKKADLVKRLQESDAQNPDGAAPAASKNDDEIDWDDEPAAAANEASKASTDAAATAIAAGGQGQPANPQAVPNQQVDIDPSQTNDLTVSKPSDDASTAQPADSEPATTAADAAAPSEAQQAEEAKPAVDFTSGLKVTTLDQEIEKRKARAKKFGLNEDEDEALKALERAKRFGNTDLPGKLNEALPERRERKRGAPSGEEDQGARKKRGGGAGNAGAGNERRGGAGNERGGRRDGGRRNGAPQSKAAAPAAAPASKAKPAMSDADKAKAEARKARFG